MRKKWLLAVLALALVSGVYARDLGSEAPQGSLGARGNVTTTGSLVVIPGVAGSQRVTYSVIIANDSATDNLLVALDVPDGSATYVPTPSTTDITVMTRVMVVLPGEKLSLDVGAQQIGLRAESGTIPARMIITKR